MLHYVRLQAFVFEILPQYFLAIQSNKFMIEDRTRVLYSIIWSTSEKSKQIGSRDSVGTIWDTETEGSVRMCTEWEQTPSSAHSLNYIQAFA